MRVLFPLIFTHCFGCVILVDKKGEFLNDKLVTDPGNINFCYDLKITNQFLDPTVARDRMERYMVPEIPGDWITDDLDKRSTFAKDSPAEGRPSNHRYQPDNYSSDKRKSRFFSPRAKIREKFAAAFCYRRGKDARSRLRNDLMLRENREEKTAFHVRRTLALEKNYETKVSSKKRNRRSCNGPNVNEKKDSMTSNDGRNARKDDPDVWDDDADAATEEDGEEDTGEWDEWTEWSECSASCGCGRQVRWQHCIGKACPFGLKRAQIRTCHLRDCNKKNLLSWLGVKA